MKRWICLLLLAALSPAQEGGRDPGDRTPPVLFVRWRASAESHAIYSAAWSALEPFDLSRERLITLHEDAQRADEVLKEFSNAAAVVAFGARTAQVVRAALPEAPLIEVSPRAGAHVDTLVDRDDFARLLRRFRPAARRVAVFGGVRYTLAGFETFPCSLPEQARGCDLAWIPEASDADPHRIRAELDRLKIPLVTTSERHTVGLAALGVRVDPGGAGRQAAALVLGLVRAGQKPEPRRVRRLRVTVDLEAARAAGHLVPLAMLARADAVRRAR